MSEVYYLAATNGIDHNYYRIRVTGETHLGVAEFREGWFPARAVDSLFGEASMEGMSDALSVEEKLRDQLDGALVVAHKEYLAAAIDIDAAPETVEARLDAIARVQLFPGTDRARLPESVVLEYDPKKNLVTEHAADKLVMVLSSDPDAVIGKLTGLVEDAQTEKLVGDLTGIVAARERMKNQEFLARSQIETRTDQRIRNQLQSTRDRLGDGATSRDKGLILGDLDALISVLQEIER